MDFLRICVIILVVFNHTEGFTLYNEASNVAERWLYFSISYLCKIAVPVFYMISGALLLGKNESLQDVLIRRVLRFSGILVVISFVFFLKEVYSGKTMWSIREFVYTIYSSRSSTHLWYLYSYIALLVMLPLLRRMAGAMRDKEFLYLGLVSVLLYDIRPFMEKAMDIATLNVEFAPVIFSSSAVVFFLMGYFIEHRLPQRFISKKVILVGAVASMLAIAAMGWVVMYREAGFQQWLLIFPVCTFYLAVKRFFDRNGCSLSMVQLLATLGNATFGIYLFEPFFRQWSKPVYHLTVPYLGAMGACLVWSGCAVLLGFLFICIMRKIPAMKWLVG